MATKPYSNEQRRIAAAVFYKMSSQIRVKPRKIKIDRDIFIILARLYVAHHAGETVHIAQLEEPVGKQWGAVKAKLVRLEKHGLVKLEGHPHDGRATSIQVQPELLEFFGPIVDELIDMMCMSVECIKGHGAKRHRRAEDVQEFCEKILEFCRLDAAAVSSKKRQIKIRSKPAT